MKLCRALSDLVVYTNSVAAQDIVDDGKAAGTRLSHAFFTSGRLENISLFSRFPFFSKERLKAEQLVTCSFYLTVEGRVKHPLFLL